jgi:hypothetical protein
MPTVEHRRAAQSSPPVHGRCHRCGDQVIACTDHEDRLIAVHPIAVPGGELIINGSQCRIVQVLTSREASAAHRRGDLGFVPHARLCRRPGLR